MRRHGLQCPLDPYQVGSWILFAGLVSGCYVFYMPFIDNLAVRWTLVAIYTVLVVFVFGLAFFTSWTDPSDSGLFGATDGDYYCALCQANVSRCSKHCRACDRCVVGFDHHCKWLNNCIGSKNYRQFFFLVAFTVSMLLVQFGWGIYLFARCFYDSSTMDALIQDKYAGVNFNGYKVGLAVYLVFLLAAILMLGELLFFHIILVSKGMTTYDYIIAQRDQKLAAAAATRPASQGLLGCKNNQVYDEGQLTTRRKVKVHINPCAALKTEKIGQPVRNNSKPTEPAALSEEQLHDGDSGQKSDSDSPDFDKSIIYGKAVVSESSDCSSKFASTAAPPFVEGLRAAVELVPPPLRVPEQYVAPEFQNSEPRRRSVAGSSLKSDAEPSEARSSLRAPSELPPLKNVVPRLAPPPRSPGRD